ncbi:uncharacterized protein LOC115325907 [Ixodes scapularis]|uniref:uncharacterized protein LOC115325907 n=1 Tax=Ixodes scapularis TaxID=6945 RepID=UPI001AD6F9D0|nr:uncharacterized protein LOC115325907 [Ixodes scapularis]
MARSNSRCNCASTKRPARRTTGDRSPGPSSNTNHTNFDQESPEIKRLCMTKDLQSAKKKIHVIKTILKRKEQKIKDPKTLVEGLRDQHVLTDELRLKLEAFGEIPQELLKGFEKNATRKLSGRRYSERTKQFAATLHYYSPQAYDYVSRLFPLPSVSSLRSWLKVFGGWPGFTREALGELQRRHTTASWFATSILAKYWDRTSLTRCPWQRRPWSSWRWALHHPGRFPLGTSSRTEHQGSSSKASLKTPLQPLKSVASMSRPWFAMDLGQMLPWQSCSGDGSTKQTTRASSQYLSTRPDPPRRYTSSSTLATSSSFFETS